eukprot:315554-Chlamydomonas_euryale.AAC.3
MSKTGLMDGWMDGWMDGVCVCVREWVSMPVCMHACMRACMHACSTCSTCNVCELAVQPWQHQGSQRKATRSYASQHAWTLCHMGTCGASSMGGRMQYVLQAQMHAWPHAGQNLPQPDGISMWP